MLTARDSAMDMTRYSQFAAVGNITLLRLGVFGKPQSDQKLHATFREIVVPRSAQQAETETAVGANSPIDLTQATIVRLLTSTPAYGEELRTIAKQNDLCLVADAALGDIAAAMLQVPIIYDAPRIEACAASADAPGTMLGTLLADLKAAEKRLCKRAISVIVRGNDDARALSEGLAYPNDPAVIRTGITPDPDRYRTAGQRVVAKAAMNLADRIVAIFEGDGSVESVCAILSLSEIARQHPGVLFFITGLHFSREYPQNMRFLERVTDLEMVTLRNIADCAVVPYERTPGTPAQVFNAVLAGVPLLASPSALKNMPLIHGRDVLSGAQEALPGLLTSMLAEPVRAEARAVSAYATLLSASPPAFTAMAFRSFIEQLPATLPATG